MFEEIRKTFKPGGFNNFGKPTKAPNPRLPYSQVNKKPSLLDKIKKVRPKEVTEPDYIVGKGKINGIRPKSHATDPGLDALKQKETLYFPTFEDSIYTLTKAKAKLYRFMRDTIPDIDAGIWAWTRICDTKRKLIINGGTDIQKAKALEIVNMLDERLYEHDFVKASGFDLLSGRAFMDMFTTGSSAGEVWIGNGGRQVNKFLTVPPESIRFKRKNRVEVEAYQYWESSNKLAKLNKNTFIYMPLNLESAELYGKSMLTSIPFVSLIQNQLMRDMSAAMHNAGYTKYHYSMTPPPKLAGESKDAYTQRISSQFNEFIMQMTKLNPEDNIATYDNIDVKVPSGSGGGGGSAVVWYDSYKAVEEQIISGLKLAPFMIGRNYDTTGEFGTAQYDLILRNATAVQRIVGNMLAWLANLELAMKGSPCRVQIEYDNTRTVGALLESQAELMRTKATIIKRNEGILSQKETAEELGYDQYDHDGPNPKFMNSQISVDQVGDTMPTNGQASLDNMSEQEILRLTDRDILDMNLDAKTIREIRLFKRDEASKKHRHIEETHDIDFG